MQSRYNETPCSKCSGLMHSVKALPNAACEHVIGVKFHEARALLFPHEPGKASKMTSLLRRQVSFRQGGSCLQAGTVFVNTPGTVDDTLPFGGYKESGVGRDKGEAAIHHYTINKTVYQACTCFELPSSFACCVGHSNSMHRRSKSLSPWNCFCCNFAHSRCIVQASQVPCLVGS